MAHTSSAKRHVRSDEKRRARNRSNKSACATQEKKFIKLIADGKLDEAKIQLQVVFSQFDKNAKKGVFKTEKADRKKSRLALQLNKAAASKA